MKFVQIILEWKYRVELTSYMKNKESGNMLFCKCEGISMSDNECFLQCVISLSYKITHCSNSVVVVGSGGVLLNAKVFKWIHWVLKRLLNLWFCQKLKGESQKGLSAIELRNR